MAKPRLIFTLHMDGGVYMLSRNFSLQAVGDAEWIRTHYNFDAIAFSIDELIVLNVERRTPANGGKKNTARFAENLAKLNERCFMPMAVGGGIESMEDAERLLRAGADKLVVNTILYEKPDLVRELVTHFGKQCIVASIDYKRKKTGGTEVFTRDGSVPAHHDVETATRLAQELGCGEIFLTSMDRDGTGQGYDLEIIEKTCAISEVPVIASGGVGKYEHFVQGIQQGHAQASSTANLFNFIDDGLMEARMDMQRAGIRMAQWSEVAA